MTHPTPATGHLPKRKGGPVHAHRPQVPGLDLASFKGAHVQVAAGKAAIRAEELAAWLKVQQVDGMLGPVDITGADWQDKIKDKRGIVAFKDYWTRPGETTPHR